MRAIVQRVTSASVQVRSGSAQRVGAGWFVLASGEPQATPETHPAVTDPSCATRDNPETQLTGAEHACVTRVPLVPSDVCARRTSEQPLEFTSESVTSDELSSAEPTGVTRVPLVQRDVCARCTSEQPLEFTSESVTGDNQPYTAEIQNGLCLLVGVHTDDTAANAKKLAEKIANLRIFNDEEGKMNRSLLDNPGYDVLAVSNFTVYGDTKKNRRPSFAESAPYERAQTLFDIFVTHLRTLGFKSPTGVFGADMEVTITNDGPVTLIVDA